MPKKEKKKHPTESKDRIRERVRQFMAKCGLPPGPYKDGPLRK